MPLLARLTHVKSNDDPYGIEDIEPVAITYVRDMTNVSIYMRDVMLNVRKPNANVPSKLLQEL